MHNKRVKKDAAEEVLEGFSPSLELVDSSYEMLVRNLKPINRREAENDLLMSATQHTVADKQLAPNLAALALTRGADKVDTPDATSTTAVAALSTAQSASGMAVNLYKKVGGLEGRLNAAIAVVGGWRGDERDGTKV